jgi:hypothetical protein
LRLAPAAARVASSSLLMLQEGGEPVEDRAARRQGHDLPSALDGLHRALLGGADGLASLDRLDQALTRGARRGAGPGAARRRWRRSGCGRWWSGRVISS